MIIRAREWGRDLGLPRRTVERVFEQVIATGKLELGHEAASETARAGVVSMLLAVPVPAARGAGEPLTPPTSRRERPRFEVET